MRTGPKWRVYDVHEAALMLAYLSREAGRRKTALARARPT